MALVKPMYLNSSGFAQEMATTDSLAVGGITLNGNIDMQSLYKVINLVQPSASGDALAWGKNASVENLTVTGALGAALSAGSFKITSLAQASATGDALAWGQNASVANFTVTGALGADMAAGSHKITGLLQASATGDALAWGQNASVANLSVTGSLGAALNAGAFKITNLADPASAQDAATKAYVDAVKTGLDFKDSVRAISTSNITLSGTQTIDGVAVVAGDRVLVAGQTTASANGIYVVAAGAWSRSTDADNTPGIELGPGAFTFVEEGTTYKDTGWVMTSDSPFTLGTSACAWVQFSSAGVILAGSGLSKVGNTLNVNAGSGLVIDGGNNVAVTLASNSGLQFTSGALDLKLASADRLSEGASGLDVVGVPSLFKIAGSAVSANVTASNLGTLTAGILSDGSALHNHNRVEYAATASGVSAADAVYVSATDTVAKADAGDDAKRYVNGVAKSVSGGSAQVVEVGVCAGILSGATAGARYWLQDGGGIGTTMPGVGKNLIQIGFAKNATDLDVRIFDYGKRAA